MRFAIVRLRSWGATASVLVAERSIAGITDPDVRFRLRRMARLMSDVVTVDPLIVNDDRVATRS